jgi:hypothetical protein
MNSASSRIFSLATALSLVGLVALPLMALQPEKNSANEEYDLKTAIVKSRQTGDPILAYVYDST